MAASGSLIARPADLRAGRSWDDEAKWRVVGRSVRHGRDCRAATPGWPGRGRGRDIGGRLGHGDRFGGWQGERRQDG
jgi:hypothetical protein